MSRIALDSKSHQAIREEGTEDKYYGRNQRVGEWQSRRLEGLRSDLDSRGHEFEIVDLEDDTLADAGVLVIAGRHDRVAFTDAELNTIANFSRSGGILLMGNHPPGFVSPQNKVCERLDLSVSFRQDKGKTGTYSLLPHETSHGCSGVHIRTGCKLSVAATPLASVTAKYSDEENGILAVAIEEGDGHGRIVAVGSAGHISSHDDSGSDLYSKASNAEWTLKSIEWLLH